MLWIYCTFIAIDGTVLDAFRNCAALCTPMDPPVVWITMVKSAIPFLVKKHHPKYPK